MKSLVELLEAEDKLNGLVAFILLTSRMRVWPADYAMRWPQSKELIEELIALHDKGTPPTRVTTGFDKDTGAPIIGMKAPNPNTVTLNRLRANFRGTMSRPLYRGLKAAALLHANLMNYGYYYHNTPRVFSQIRWVRERSKEALARMGGEGEFI